MSCPADIWGQPLSHVVLTVKDAKRLWAIEKAANALLGVGLVDGYNSNYDHILTPPEDAWLDFEEAMRENQG